MLHFDDEVENGDRQMQVVVVVYNFDDDVAVNVIDQVGQVRQVGKKLIVLLNAVRIASLITNSK